MQHRRVPSTLRPPLALAALALACGIAHAGITASGSTGTWHVPLPLGPGSTSLPGAAVYVGSGSAGSLSVDAGSFLDAASVFIGTGGTGAGTMVLDGPGTKLNLVGDGYAFVNRLDVGSWGSASLQVSGGALLDGMVNAGACVAAGHSCGTSIGSGAGTSSLLTINGTGSEVRLFEHFTVGGVTVRRPPIDTYTFGTPGGTTTGRVQVLAGATLRTDRGTLGTSPGTASALGTERSFAEMTIDGAGSVWHVGGGTLDGPGAFVTTGNGRNAWATLSVTNGGVLRFDGPYGLSSGLNLTQNGGRSDMLVSGAGSRVEFLSDAGVLQVGRSLGSASLIVREGAQISGLYYMSVGRDAARGDLTLSGSGSLLLINGTASAAANGTVVGAGAGLDIGRNGGYGQVTITAGGRIHMLAEQGLPGLSLNLGRDVNSAGLLTIQGAGSVLLMESISVLPGGGPGEAPNPVMRVGRDGSGTLNISDGGKLLLQGEAVSIPADRRSTSLIIGGFNDNTPGGHGIATVSGAGSEIRVNGMDTFIGIGIGPQSSGQLNVSDQGLISGMGINVGRSGGVGVLKMDAARLAFSGQQPAGNQSGAYFSVGSGGGIGVATIDNGSFVTLSNMGSAGASLNLGGSGAYPMGDGSLTLAGGSKIMIEAQSGRGTATIGREGSGFMRLRGASVLDNSGGNLYVGRLAGSDGTLIASEGSSVSAGWVGIGRNRVNGVDEDGGSGTLILINSTLTAQDIVIGSKGFLCGTGSITGNVVNHGIFCPGNSPGTLNLNGDFSAMSGSRMILEVEDDGAGGYLTDVVVFGGAVALGAMAVEFRFLGATNPVAFQSSGRFDIDTFLGRSDGAGGMVALADQSFEGVQFSAQADGYVISNFSFSAADGAAFSAQPVPEPQTWAMLLLGLVGLVLGTRRQRGLALPG